MTTSSILDNFWEIVPLRLDLVPSEEAQTQALHELRQILSGHEECDTWTTDYVQVIGLFKEDDQHMTCPSCGKRDTLLS